MAESIFAALLAERPDVLRLLPARFTDPEAWRAAAIAASARQAPLSLVEELERQSQALAASDARKRNLEKLARPGTTVVVTGQQVGLFGGPLYTLHKAATAIARARMVEAMTGQACVPLFWLQTEDHDYAEIAQVAVLAPEGPCTFALPAETPASRISIAHRVLPPETSAPLARVEETLASLPHATEVVTLLRAHYITGRPIAAAFAGLLAELWRDEGLLILDPRVPAIARLAAPLLGRVLEQHVAIAADLTQRAAKLSAAGYHEQVRTRQNASLVFFHPDAITGPRYRLVQRANGWETPAGPVSQAALLALLDREPLRFSSSALLRPLVQDTLLPTCAYVGGPAEVAYFAQLAPLYARLGVPMPLIAPRARLRVLDATTRSLLGRLGLRAADLEQARESVLTQLALHASGDEQVSDNQLRARLLAALERELDALADRKLEGLADPIRKTRETCVRALDKLAHKAERALLERDRVAVERIDRLHAALYPHGVPQERAYGFLAHAAHGGISNLLSAVLEGARSLDPGVRDVSL